MRDSESCLITEFMTSFQKALCAVIPIAEEIGMPWKEPDSYDQWDSIEEGLYKGFVLVEIGNSTAAGERGLLPFARYGFNNGDYSNYSYVAVPWQNEIYPFICLQTSSTPFDTCLLAKIDTNGKRSMSIEAPLKECKFVVVLKAPSGTKVIDTVFY